MATTEEPTAIVTTDDVAAALRGEGVYTVPIEDAEAASRAIIDRVLSAETPEDVMEAANAQTTPAKDLIGVPLVLRGVRFMPSSIEGEGPSVFAVLDAVHADDGEAFTITTGARTVLAQVLKLDQLKAYPWGPVQFVEADTPTASGFYPMQLAKVEASA